MREGEFRGEVVYEYDFNPNELGLPDDPDYLEDYFENQVGVGVYRHKPNCCDEHVLEQSSCECVILSYNDKIYFPSDDKIPCDNGTTVKDNLHAYVLYESWVKLSGICGGMYHSDYNGCCSYFDWKAVDKLFIPNEKTKQKQIDVLIDLYEKQEELNSNTVHLSDLPLDDNFPKIIKDAIWHGVSLEIMEFIDINPNYYKVEVETNLEELGENDLELTEGKGIKNISEPDRDGNVKFHFTVPIANTTLLVVFKNTIK